MANGDDSPYDALVARVSRLEDLAETLLQVIEQLRVSQIVSHGPHYQPGPHYQMNECPSHDRPVV